jgi:hypothetical protein
LGHLSCPPLRSIEFGRNDISCSYYCKLFSLSRVTGGLSAHITFTGAPNLFGYLYNVLLLGLRAEHWTHTIYSKKRTGMGVPTEKDAGYSTSASSSTHSPPSMPPPPYFKTHFIKPTSFKTAVNVKLDKPIVSLFRLSIRLLQFAFALASGIPYAIELSHTNTTPKTDFIYAQVVFGLTLLTLVIDSIKVRYYRFTWLIEWTLVVLWIACFGVFYNIYLDGAIEDRYEDVDLGRMKRAVWCDFINALLWMGSALFSTVMCCSGIKAAVKDKLENRRQRKEGKKMANKMEAMESGVVGGGRE